MRAQSGSGQLRVGASMLQSGLAGQQRTRGLGAQLPLSTARPREGHRSSHLLTLEDSSSEGRFWSQKPPQIPLKTTSIYIWGHGETQRMTCLHQSPDDL